MHTRSASAKPQKRSVRGLQLAYSALLAVCFLNVNPTVSFAADSSQDSLIKLEQRFFQHSYPKEGQTQRIDRIEKMVYGETRTGSDQSRLANLMQSLPAEGTATPDADGPAAASSASSSNSSAPSGAAPSRSSPAQKTVNRPAPAQSSPPEPRENVSGTKYPAVTAIEQKVLHKSYETEIVEDRLARLETKLFGKPSNATDLGDRVDRLKQSTGVDIAVHPPSGSDWTDDDDDSAMVPQQSASSRGQDDAPYAAKPGEDGMSFSGRDLRADMRKAFGGMSTGGGSGSYGMGSGMTSGFGSGAYGFGGGSRSAAPQRRQSPVNNSAPPAVASSQAPARMGLSQQVAALESEIFGKTYNGDLPGRLTRIESTVFPSDKTAGTKPLPERVNRLLAAIPISNTVPAKAPKIAQKSHDKDFTDDDDLGLPLLAPQRGLGSIMNQMGNMVSGNGGMMPGNGFVGGYSMPSGTMMTDPGTGLLIDRTTGNLIDPNTGMVVGRRISPAPAYVPPPVYMAPAYGRGMVVPPMTNGFSPYTTVPGGGLRGLGMWP